MKMLEIKVGGMAAMVAGAAPTRKLAGERERERERHEPGGVAIGCGGGQ
jgi:hypothetical protein